MEKAVNFVPVIGPQLGAFGALAGAQAAMGNNPLVNAMNANMINQTGNMLLPTHNSRGQTIPVVQIDLQEAVATEGAGLEPDDIEEERKTDPGDEDQPLIQDDVPPPETIPVPSEEQKTEPVQPPPGVIPMGQRPPLLTMEEIQARQQLLREFRVEVQRRREEEERKQINQGLGNRVPEAERQNFVDWASRVYRQGNNIGVLTMDNFLRASDILVRYFWFTKEDGLQPYKPDPSDGDPDDNKRRTEFFNKTALPPQCNRRLYTDSNGVIRSVVICESLGSERVYHDH